MPELTPPGHQPIDLTGAIATAISGAAERGVPVSVAYVDRFGRPHVSPRGTVQVWESGQLALWARSQGLPDAVAVNPQVALLCQDLPNHTLHQFTGRARTVDDDVSRERVFATSPAHEQAQDPGRAGTAIIIDIDTVRGRSPDGMVHMERDPA